MFKTINKQEGFLKFIILIIIAIIALSYFGFDIRSIVEAPQTQNNIKYVWEKVVYVWDTYLDAIFRYLWNDVFINLLWNSFIDNMERLKAGQSSTIEQLAPATIPLQ